MRTTVSLFPTAYSFHGMNSHKVFLDIGGKMRSSDEQSQTRSPAMRKEINGLSLRSELICPEQYKHTRSNLLNGNLQLKIVKSYE